MRLAEYTAPDGTKHLAWLRNADADEDAQALGVPHDPPDVGSLGLDAETARAPLGEPATRRAQRLG